jgi:hypothetical protein
LHDIREAGDMIQAFLEGMEASAFLASELPKAATLQKLTVIGAAAAHLVQRFADQTTGMHFFPKFDSHVRPCPMHQQGYAPSPKVKTLGDTWK